MGPSRREAKQLLGGSRPAEGAPQAKRQTGRGECQTEAVGWRRTAENGSNQSSAGPSSVWSARLLGTSGFWWRTAKRWC